MTPSTPELSETVRALLAAGDDSAEAITARIAERWDLLAPLPVPRPGWLKCPVCRAVDVIPREWRIGTRNLPRGAALRRLPWRIDVGFKCLDCSTIWWHGLAVTETAALRRLVPHGTRVIHWREAAGLLRAWASGQEL